MADECGHIIKIIKIVWLIKDKINVITAFDGVGKKTEIKEWTMLAPETQEGRTKRITWVVFLNM